MHCVFKITIKNKHAKLCIKKKRQTQTYPALKSGHTHQVGTEGLSVRTSKTEEKRREKRGVTVYHPGGGISSAF